MLTPGEAVPLRLRGSVSRLQPGAGSWRVRASPRCAVARTTDVRPCPRVSPTHTLVRTPFRSACHALKIDANPSACSGSQRQQPGQRRQQRESHGPGAACACDRPRELRPPHAARREQQLPGDQPHCGRSHRVAATVPITSKMCPGNWLWASMTFMARFSRSSSRTPVRTRGSLEEMPAVQHPFLNVFELERLLYTGKTACNHADEVWPGLYLGDQDMANNRRELRRLGITHVLNASHSRWRGTPEAYEGLGIRYLGVEAHDSPAFDMSIHFQTAADFIHRALSQPGGKILVHCAVGVSRSATLVLAYLMLYHHFTLVEAIKKVKDHRGIIPNRGFLRQLLALDRRLRQGLEA